MAYDPKDIYLYNGEPNPNDVRLRDPSATSQNITMTVGATTESYTSLTLIETFVANIGSYTETKAGGVFVESFVLAITAKGETYAGLALVESFALAIGAVTETFSAAVLVETFATAIQAVTETYAALVTAEAVNVDAVITAGTETGADAVAGVINPTAPARTNPGGGSSGYGKKRKYQLPEDYDEKAPFRRNPVPVPVGYDEPEPWSVEKDQQDEDEMMSVFALMIDEDLF